MTAARDYLPTPPPTHRRRKSTTVSRRYQPSSRQVAPSRRHQSSTNGHSKVTQLPRRSQSLPLALQFMLLVQKSSTLLTFGLVTITLGVYGWTVYAPTLWSKEFSKLKTLQRDERQLISTNETLKHKMAKQAEQPGSGLTQPNPSQSLFLSPTDSPDIKLPTNTHSTEQELLAPESPVSY